MTRCSVDHAPIRFDADYGSCPWCAERKIRAEADGWNVLRDLLAQASTDDSPEPTLPPRSGIPVKLGIVIPIRNRPGPLQACLSSLGYQSEPADRIVVSDLGSDEESAARTAVLARHAGAAALWQAGDAWIKGRAVNEGAESLRRAGMTHILILDADVMLHPEALARIRQHLGAHEAVAIAPRDTGSHPPSIDAARFDALARISRPRGGNDQVGGVVAFPLDWFLMVGGIHEGFVGWGWQDVDLWRRAEAELSVLVVHPTFGPGAPDGVHVLALHQAHAREPLADLDEPRNRALFKGRQQRRVDARFQRGQVVISMPTISGREANAERVLQALLPQLREGDTFIVHLNGAIPPAERRLPKRPARQLRLLSHPVGTGPLIRFDLPDDIGGEYLLTVDDDIEYPADYVARTVEAIKAAGAVSWHVRWWDEPGTERPAHYNLRRVLRIDEGSDDWVRSSYGGCGVMGLTWDKAQAVRDSLAVRESGYFEHCDDLWVSAQIGPLWRPPSAARWIAIQKPHPTETLYAAAHQEAFARREWLMGVLWERAGWRQEKRLIGEPIGGRVLARADFCVGITAYNRPELLADLLRDIDAQARDFDVRVVVLDDASNSAPTAPHLGMANAVGCAIQMSAHGGKRGFADLVSALYGQMESIPAEVYIQLPDDARLCRDFFLRARAALDEAATLGGVAVNLLIDSGRGICPCWTGIEPTRQGDLWHTGWIDGAAVFGRAYLDALDAKVPPIPERWHDADPPRGSGVGWAISRRLVARGHGLYQASQSLIALVDVPSQLNGDVERVTPSGRLLTVDYIDGDEELRALAERRIAVVDGARFWTHGAADHISRQLLAGFWYERALLEAIRDIDREGVYIDVGANIGTHAVWYASRCRATRVEAFEPFAPSRLLLQTNLLTNSGDTPWGSWSAPVGRTGNYMAQQPVDPSNVGMVRFAPDKRDGENSVECIGLDEAFINSQEIALMKFDIEGGELDAIRGARRLIRRDLPHIVVEAHTGELLKQLLRTAALRGYKILGCYCATPTYLLEPPERSAR